MNEFAAHSGWAFARHPVGLGELVLDVGCGTGETSIELGELVGDTGAVLGVDCAAPLVERARADAARAGVMNVQFDVLDAEIHRFDPSFDLCFARFGTMFFRDPVAAMRNLRGAVRPGGRLIMLVWRSPSENEWARPNSDPGLFSMADRETVQRILDAAGWRNAGFERVDAPVRLGGIVMNSGSWCISAKNAR